MMAAGRRAASTLAITRAGCNTFTTFIISSSTLNSSSRQYLYRRAMSSTSYSKVLTLDTINPNVKNVEYAVRGELSNRAGKYSDMISQGKGNDLPFKSVVTANIGNPQQQPYLAQKPLTFWRQVSK